MTKPQDTDSTISELRASITKLTGKEPASADPVYLRQRLVQLQKKKKSGVRIRRASSGGTAPLSASMPIKARAAFDRIQAKEKVSTSALVRRALAFWADANGYKDEAAALGAG